jgi:hypothetical protein
VQRSVMPIGFFHIPIKCDVIDQRKNKCIHFDAKRPWTAQGERGTSGPCALRVHRQRPRPRKAEALVVPPDASALHGGFAAIPTRSVPGLRKGSEVRADLAPFVSTSHSHRDTASRLERLKLWSFLPALQHSTAASPHSFRIPHSALRTSSCRSSRRFSTPGRLRRRRILPTLMEELEIERGRH